MEYPDGSVFIPTAFKRQGEFIFYSSVHFLFQSLMLKYDVFSDDADLFGQAIKRNLEERLNLVQYDYTVILLTWRIKSAFFLGKIKVRLIECAVV